MRWQWLHSFFSRLSFIFWFWHLFLASWHFWHFGHFGILRPKSRHHEWAKMPKLRHLWSLMMCTFESQNTKNVKNAKMPKTRDQRCQSNSGDACFWINRCQNAIIRYHRSQGDIQDILWWCILESMMPKWCQKNPLDNKTSYTFERQEIY